MQHGPKEMGIWTPVDRIWQTGVMEQWLGFLELAVGSPSSLPCCYATENAFACSHKPSLSSASASTPAGKSFA